MADPHAFHPSSKDQRRRLARPGSNGLAALTAASFLCLAATPATSQAMRSASPGTVEPVAASPFHGQVRMSITSLTEHIDSFTVRSQGRLQKTGPVVLTLDPAYPQLQTISLDFDSMEIVIQTRLLINAPLLSQHGARPTPISVTERGRFTIGDVERSRNGRSASMTVRYETLSSGTIGSGPFAAAAQKNRKRHVDDCSYPANKARLALVLSPDGGIVGAASPADASSLLCAADAGTLTFDGYESAFRGRRSGTLAPGRP